MEKTAEHTHTHDHDHEHPHDHHHSHTHTHDPEHIRKILNRFSRSIGHLDSVRRRVERGEDCADVLVQLAAVRGEINKISQLILKEHLDHCILDAMETHDHEAIEKLNEAIDKLMR